MRRCHDPSTGRVHIGGRLAVHSGSITVWLIKDDGTIEPKNGVYNAATGCVEFTTEHLSQYLVVNFPFADVAENSWYYDSVSYAYNNALFAGTSGTAFSPDSDMSTPALVVDGKVVSYGKVLKTEEVVKILQKVR